MGTINSSTTATFEWQGNAVQGGVKSSTAMLPACEVAKQGVFSRYYSGSLAVLAGLVGGVAKGVQPLSSSTNHRFDQVFDLTGSSSEADFRHAARELQTRYWRSLANLEKADLAFGDRVSALGRILDNGMHESPALAIDAAMQILSAESEDISDDARAGVIRYLASGYENVARSNLVRMCIASLGSHYELQVAAAAKSLEEIGDPGVLPLLRSMASKPEYSQVQEEIQGAIRGIIEFYESSKGSAERIGIKKHEG
jgi:hypothetical protein